MAIRELITGIYSYFKAGKIILKNNLLRYMLLPSILSLAYIILLIILGILYLTDLSAYIDANCVPDFMRGGIMYIILSILLWVIFLVVIFVTYKDVVLIFFSPILGCLSERTEKIIYNRDPPSFNFKRLLSEIIRAVILFIRNLFFMLVLTFIFWLVIFIPVLGTIMSVICILLIQSYYTGAGLVDFVLERKGYSVKESMRFSRENRARITGLGMGFIVILMIPVIGWFAAPGCGTVAGTLTALEVINKK